MAKRRIVSKKRYSNKAIIREREYGFFWYSWIWRIARPALILSIALLISLGVVARGWTYVYDGVIKPMAPNDKTTVTFEVPSGASVAKIGQLLAERDLLRSPTLFRYTVMFQGVTNKMQYGSYQISPSMSVNEIISILTSGSASNERTITIIPGWTIDNIIEYLYRTGAITDVEEFKRLCNNTVEFGNFYSVRRAIEDRSLTGRKYVLEGYLAPDTYQIYTNATAESIIRRLLDQMDLVLNDVLPDEDERGVSSLTSDQYIILASMIEKEAVKDEDFARVSAVFHNRLKSGMRLESDPTVKYTLGVSTMVLTGDQLSVETPYNTYRIPNLPVGPICNPSKRAIEAALNPDPDYIAQNYLFFCSREPASGELEFSKTKAEHDAAVAQYRPLWRAYDEERAAKATAAAPYVPIPTPTPGS